MKRPLVISFLNQKGGVGKTTLATNISRAIQQDGNKVLLVDSDPQGSARDWNEVNDGTIVSVIGLDRESLAHDIEAVRSDYDFIVIDGAPQIAKMSAAAVKISDVIVIPVQPSPYDIWACSDLVEIIELRKEVKPDLKVFFLINRAIKNTKLEGEVKVALQDYKFPILETYTTQRIIYPTVASDGKTVFESSDKKAIEEIDNIKNELMKGIKNGAADKKK